MLDQVFCSGLEPMVEIVLKLKNVHKSETASEKTAEEVNKSVVITLGQQVGPVVAGVSSW